MALAAGDIKVTYRGLWLGQVWNNVQWYRVEGIGSLVIDANDLGEALWNDMKVDFRAMMEVADGPTFEDILLQEPGASGAYGTFAIPTAEKSGTRTVATAGQALPPANAAGFRLTVGTRVTRPGQKRIVGATEADNNGLEWAAGYLSLLDTLAAHWASPLVMGSPAVGVALTPEIVRYDPVSKVVVARQDVTGYVVNTRPTTQVSRKWGRGS